jgi:putative ABC transport system permease protein
MDSIASQLEREYPDVNESHTVSVNSLQNQIFGSYRVLLLTLMAAVGFLLLISCINVVNLLLARASERGPEIAIRTSLGAGRGRLIRQLLAESLLLAALGAVLGLVFAFFIKNLLVRLGFEALPVSGNAEIDARVLLFTLALTIVTGLAFGLVPGLRASSPKLTAVLKEGGGRTTGAMDSFLGRKTLVAFEVAMAVILLAGAGLTASSLFRMQNVDLGFQPDQVLSLDISLPETHYPNGERQAAFFRQATERVESLPTVRSAAWVTHPPLSARSNSTSFYIDGRVAVSAVDQASADFRGVTDGYFETLGVPLVGGRTFTDADSAMSQQVAVVDTATARQYWPGESPVGKRISLKGPQGPWITIVGQVGDVRYTAPGEEERPTIYYAFTQEPRGAMTLIARTVNDPAASVEPVRRELLAVDPNQPVENAGPMSRTLATKLQGRRVNTLLLGVFSLIALLLSGIGIYGVISQYVAQYVREIGIRMALGAQRRDIFTLVLKQAMGAVLVGVVVGVLGAVGLARFIASLLFDVQPSDPTTFLGVALLLITVALLACSMPAARAVGIQPVTAMRYE